MTKEQIENCKSEFVHDSMWPALADSFSSLFCDSDALIRFSVLAPLFVLLVGAIVFAFRE